MIFENPIYSIHTFELYEKIIDSSIIKMLFDKSKPIWKSKTKSGTTTKNTYIAYNNTLPSGVTQIKIDTLKEENGYFIAHLHIKINPARHYEENDINLIEKQKLTEALDAIMHKLVLMLGEPIVSALLIRRIDFTADIRFDTQEYVDEYIKLLKKALPTTTLEEYMFWDEKQRRHISYTDSLYLQCRSYDFQIYPKQKELANRNSIQTDEAKGILRFELRAKRQKIQRLTKQRNLLDNVIEWIDCISDRTKEIILCFLQKIIGTGDFYTLNKINRIIDNSGYKNKTKTEMKKVSEYLSTKKSGKYILSDLNMEKVQLRKLLKHFNELGCSPIPVPTRAKENFYPNIFPIEWRPTLLIEI